jgi:ABC-type cobalamin transport system permease subunit
LGRSLILIGAIIAALGAVVTLLLPPPLDESALLVVFLGLVLAVSGFPLFFTRWRLSRRLGICPACGADIERRDRFCHECGRHL